MYITKWLEDSEIETFQKEKELSTDSDPDHDWIGYRSIECKW